jgi:DNA-binding transcriptional MerR regulator
MKKYYSIAEFAELAHTTKESLRHYEQIGLLVPQARQSGNNNQRAYSIRQLATMNVIHAFKELGFSLAEITELIRGRSPEDTMAFLTEQIEKTHAAIKAQLRAQELSYTIWKTVNAVKNIDEQAIALEELPAANIVLGEPNVYEHGENVYDALNVFYDATVRRHPYLMHSYFVWGVYSAERVLKGDLFYPDRYFFYHASGTEKRPAGTYAVGYMRCDYGKGQALYERMKQFIAEHKLIIAGDAYEEYPLNELCVADPDDYLMRVLIPVKKM